MKRKREDGDGRMLLIRRVLAWSPANHFQAWLTAAGFLLLALATDRIFGASLSVSLMTAVPVMVGIGATQSYRLERRRRLHIGTDPALPDAAYVGGNRVAEGAECGDGHCVTRRVWCVISGLRACLLCSVVAGAGMVAETNADVSLQDVLAAVETNERLARLAEGLTAENARLREENARLRECDALREAGLSGCARSWRCCCSCWCSGGRRSGRGRRRPGMRTARARAWRAAGTASCRHSRFKAMRDRLRSSRSSAGSA